MILVLNLFVLMFSQILCEKIYLTWLGILFSISVTLALRAAVVIKLLTSGILFSTLSIFVSRAVLVINSWVSDIFLSKSFFPNLVYLIILIYVN